jgi:hypothetical protein
MINEEIIGGLVSALSRGETLENAMMTFYNAGYTKEEIEDSAKEVYKQLGPQMMGVKGSLQEALDDIAIKAGVTDTKSQSNEKPGDQSKNNLPGQIVLQTAGDKKTPETSGAAKEEEKPKPTVSGYVAPIEGSTTTDITARIEEAIKGLRPVNIPSRIEIIHKNVDANPPTVVQHVSDYFGSSQRSINKAATYVLVVILIILLIALGAIFLFRDDLIKVFNNLGIA